MDPMSPMTRTKSSFEEDDLETAAQGLVDLAIETNPPIESKLKYLADLYGGKMIGLEFKIKPLTSLLRKMNKMRGPETTVSQLVDAQYDVLRYTMLIPYERYTEGVQSVLANLTDQEGCSSVELKNYWKCMTYRGINTILLTPTDMKFELQFHTPESFDQKQNKTHILYEALRKETEPIKQNLFFLDMMSMWDNIQIPENVEKIGAEKSQDMPDRKSVSRDEQLVIDRVWKVREEVRLQIGALRNRMKLADPHILGCIEYACKLYGMHMKENDLRFRSVLRILRKVEEDLRRKLKLPLSRSMYGAETEFPSHLDGISFEEYLVKVVNHLSEAVLYKVVCEDDTNYSESVKAFLGLMVRNGYSIKSVDNYWKDMEKHHAISVTFEVIPDHRSVLHPLAEMRAKHSGCFFKIEFHTQATYNLFVERRTALNHIEEHMYQVGENYNKAAADMQVRYDATMIRHWDAVKIPAGALEIGTFRDNGLSDKPENEKWNKWLTPDERRVRRTHLAATSIVFTIGLAAGIFFGSKMLGTRRN